MQFEEIYWQYQHKIFRLCLGYANDEDWAKDLVQETFIQVHLHQHKFRNESSVGTWVYRIAVNLCLRQLDKEIRQQKATEGLQHIPEADRPDDEMVDRLYGAIASLEHTDRLIISMVLEGVKNPEIAEILGTSEGNIRVKIHRIKKSLSKLLA